MKRYLLVLLVIIPLLAFVIFRASGKKHFQPDAGKHAGRSYDMSNIVMLDMLNTIEGNKLIIALEKDVIKHIPAEIPVLFIQADSILYGKNLELIREHDGKLILASGDIAISSRIWMLLSQMGFEQIFILSDDPEPEVQKFEFRPDTAVRPEF